MTPRAPVRSTRPALVLVAVAAVLALAGCGRATSPGSQQAKGKKKMAPAAEATPTATTTAAAAPAGELKYQDVLARADAADGTVDKVVSQCPGCGLAMPGHPEHSVELEGYTLHACSDHCADHLREKPDEVMATVAQALDQN